MSTSAALYWPSTIISVTPIKDLTCHVSFYKNEMSKYSNVRLSFVDLRWAQFYVSLVSQWNDCPLLQDQVAPIPVFRSDDNNDHALDDHNVLVLQRGHHDDLLEEEKEPPWREIWWEGTSTVRARGVVVWEKRIRAGKKTQVICQSRFWMLCIWLS